MVTNRRRLGIKCKTFQRAVKVDKCFWLGFDVFLLNSWPFLDPFSSNNILLSFTPQIHDECFYTWARTLFVLLNQPIPCSTRIFELWRLYFQGISFSQVLPILHDLIILAWAVFHAFRTNTLSSVALVLPCSLPCCMPATKVTSNYVIWYLRERLHEFFAK